MSAAVPRETLSPPTVRPLLFRKYLREANAQGVKDTTRRIVRPDNSILTHGGEFKNLLLETARGAEFGTVIRSRYQFESGRVRVVSVLPQVRPGHLFWVKDGRFGSRAKSEQTLEVLVVRARRVQDLSEEDAEREGVAMLPDKFKRGSAFARHWFAKLWDDINGKGSWDANPWVWIYRYRVHAINVDRFLEQRQEVTCSESRPE